MVYCRLTQKILLLGSGLFLWIIYLNKIFFKTIELWNLHIKFLWKMSRAVLKKCVNILPLKRIWKVTFSILMIIHYFLFLCLVCIHIYQLASEKIQNIFKKYRKKNSRTLYENNTTRVTWGYKMVFITTSQEAQLSPNLPEVFVRGDRVQWVMWLKLKEINQLLVRHFTTWNVVQNTLFSNLYTWRQ